jgi:hypothetical protein
MKKTKLLVLALILGSISTGAISANAEETTGKIEFTQGAGHNGEDLYIDHVSNLDFGKKEISLTDQDYKSNGHTFSVVDLTGVYSGWNLLVKQNAQFKGNGKDLSGAALSLTDVGTPVGAKGVTAPSTINPTIAFTNFNQNQPTVQAAKDEGKGQWTFNHNANLHVPKTALAEKTTYQTTMTWTLEQAPTAP